MRESDGGGNSKEREAEFHRFEKKVRRKMLGERILFIVLILVIWVIAVLAVAVALPIVGGWASYLFFSR